MLTKLCIENIALAQKLELSFDMGMSALTGETGAGKSVIVTALSLAMGGRADKEFLRHGAQSAEVTATFDLSGQPPKFKKTYAEFVRNDHLTLRRSISHDGGAKSWVNGKRIGLARLKPLAADLGEILSQHANQSLMNEDNHLGFLDGHAGLTELAETTGLAFTEWRTVNDELSRLKNRRDQLIQQRELLLFQRDEIEKASLTVGEEEALLAERKILDSARTLMTSAALIGDLMDGESGSIKSHMTALRSELDKMTQIDPKLDDQVSELYDLDVRLEELRRAIEQYGGSIADDPVRLEEINTRLDEIYHLKKKYGGSEEATLMTLQKIVEQLSNRPDTDSLIAQLETENEQLRCKFSDLAVSLSKKRRRAARILERQCVKELKELAVTDALFVIEFVVQDDPEGVILGDRCLRPSECGLEQARFMFSANPAEPPRPLVKTASGGEVSRVLLALKSAEQTKSRVGPSLLVFDEVDSGIGGQVANEVGKKLKKLARGRQLIVITHLHQIARQADHHYVVEKTLSDDT
ncbi:MAG: DNA repair protein RecN, partial [candidate division Zixibacteria bacterium]|nr:DNA repair protein RecN [candidate division Zixibacteria bacterium]